MVKLNSRNSQDIFSAIEAIIADYKSYGHETKIIMTDREKGMAKSRIEFYKLGCILKNTVAEGHKHDSERSIRVIKERARCIASELNLLN